MSDLDFRLGSPSSNFPLEYLLSAELIARGSGEVSEVDQVNVTAKFPRFHIALDVEQGWVGAISLPSLDPTQ